MTTTPQRVRLLRGLVEMQTGHLQPIMGTPWDVPVPRKTNSRERGESSAFCMKQASVMVHGVM